MKPYCKHRNEGWCSTCVQSLLTGKNAELAIKDEKIQELERNYEGLKEVIGELNQLMKAKHGFGTPPTDDGVYFTRCRNLGWKPVTKLYGGEWAEKHIYEYFGPIPFTVWNTSDQKEVLSHLEQYNKMVLTNPSDHETYQKFMRELCKTIDNMKNSNAS